MNKILVDPGTRTRLDNLESELEFCDESGRTLGFFVPAAEAEPALYEWARREFTDEEIERARREPGGLTIDEVLDGLGEHQA